MLGMNFMTFFEMNCDCNQRRDVNNTRRAQGNSFQTIARDFKESILPCITYTVHYACEVRIRYIMRTCYVINPYTKTALSIDT
jgi:hypothetical protein